MNNSNILIDDNDIVKIQELTNGIKGTISGLTRLDSKLKKIQSSFNSSEKGAKSFSDTVKSIKAMGQSMEKLVNRMATFESKMNSMTSRLVTNFKKLKEAASSVKITALENSNTSTRRKSVSKETEETPSVQPMTATQELNSLQSNLSKETSTREAFLRQYKYELAIYEEMQAEWDSVGSKKTTQKYQDLTEQKMSAQISLEQLEAQEKIVEKEQEKVKFVEDYIASQRAVQEQLQMQIKENSTLEAQKQYLERRENVANFKVGASENYPQEFQNALKAENEWKNIVNATKLHLDQMSTLLELKQKSGLANQEDLKAIQEQKAIYDQLLKSIQAAAQASNFSTENYSSTKYNKTSLKTSQLSAENNSSSIQEENMALRQQMQIKQELAYQTQVNAEAEKLLYMSEEAENNVSTKGAKYKESETTQFMKINKQKLVAIEVDRQRRSEIMRQVSLEARLAVIDEELANTRSRLTLVQSQLSTENAKGSASNASLLEEEKQLKDTESELVLQKGNLTKSMQNNTAAARNYWQTTGQLVQVVRELPNFAISAQIGLMSLSNNLPMLMDGFRNASKEGESLGKTIISSLKSPALWANLAFVALTIVVMNLDKIMKLFGGDCSYVSKGIQEVTKGLKDNSGTAASEIQNYTKLQYQLLATSKGIKQGEDVIKKYNETFGKTYGLIKDSIQGYKLLDKHATTYFEHAVRHEIALSIVKAQTEMMNKKIQEELDSKGTTWVEREFGFNAKTNAEIHNTYQEATDALESMKEKIMSIDDKATGNNAYIDFQGKSGFSNIVSSALSRINAKGIAELEKMGLQTNQRDFTAIKAKNGKQLKQAFTELLETFKKNAAKYEQKTQNEVIEKYYSSIKEAMNTAMYYDASMPDTSSTDTGGGGGRSGRQKDKTDVNVLYFNDSYEKTKTLNDEIAVLEAKNVYLKEVYNGEILDSDKENYKKREEALKQFYRNTREISNLKLSEELGNIEENFNKEQVAFDNQIQNAKKQFADLKQKYGNNNIVTTEEKGNINANLLQGNINQLTSKKAIYDNLKANGVETYGSGEQMVKVDDMISKINEKLKNAKSILAELKLAGDGTISPDLVLRLSQLNEEIDILSINSEKATSSNNKDVQIREKTLEHSVDLTKQRKSELRDEMNIVSEQYKDDIAAINAYYEAQIKQIDATAEHLKMVISNVGAVDFDKLESTAQNRASISNIKTTTKRSNKIDTIASNSLQSSVKKNTTKSYFNPDYAKSVGDATKAISQYNLKLNEMSVEEQKALKSDAITAMVQEYENLGLSEDEASLKAKDYWEKFIGYAQTESADGRSVMEAYDQFHEETMNNITERSKKATEDIEKEYEDMAKKAGGNALKMTRVGIESFAGGWSGYRRPQEVDNYANALTNQSASYDKLIAVRQKNRGMSEAYAGSVKQTISYAQSTGMSSEDLQKNVGDSVYQSQIKSGASKEDARTLADTASEGVKNDYSKLMSGDEEAIGKLVDSYKTTKTEMREAVEGAETDYATKTSEATKAKIEAIASYGQQVAGAFRGLLDQMNATGIQKQQEALEKWKAESDELLSDQYDSQVISEKEYNAQKKGLEKEELKRKNVIAQKEFKYKQESAVADTLINTATAIMMTYAELGPIAGTPLAAFMAAIGAIQIGTILSQKAPSYYAKGTEFHQGGLAVVGDAGKSELIQTPRGELFKTPNVDTLVDLPRGSKVYPDFDKYMFTSNDDRSINVIVDTNKQVSLLVQTNRSLSTIARNTKVERHNYNRLWN